MIAVEGPLIGSAVVLLEQEMDSVSLRKYGIVDWLPFSSATEQKLLNALPTSPGVYVILLESYQKRLRGVSDIGYIGRGTNREGLRGRVRQYFHPGPTQSTNIRMNRLLGSHAFRLGFKAVVSGKEAKRLKSELLEQFEAEHDELPPYNQRGEFGPTIDDA